MKIKQKLAFWGMVGCLAIGAAGCSDMERAEQTETVRETEIAQETELETEIATNPVNLETEKEDDRSSAPEASEDAEQEAVSEEDLLEQLTAKTIIEENKDMYSGGECKAEGHIILEVLEEEDVTTIYVLTMYGEYGFYNVDYFIKTAGSGVIPVVMKFDRNQAGEAALISMEWPLDGDDYNVSVKRLFPERLWDRTLTFQSEDVEMLKSMERGYAEQYLEELGRDAVICEFGDLELEYLTDLGISVEVSNKLGSYEREDSYPYWHGSVETVEQGVRYLYSVFFDEEADQIIYEKSVFDSQETVEKYVYDAENGELIASEQ